MDPNGQSDPYCLVGLADDKTNAFIDPSRVLRSKTHFVTLNPVWKGFSIIAQSAEHKVRVEIWDKDQDVDDDFEGLAIVDLSTIVDDDVTDKWLPLSGRTEDEKVTGDVNIVVTRGTLKDLQSQKNVSVPQSPGLTPRNEDDQRQIKKLTADLRTKSGRLDQMKENNTLLDLQVVKLQQQVELLQAEVVRKNTVLKNKEDALANANAYTLELQQALQEKQSANKLAQEWDEKVQMLEQMQSVLNAKTRQYKTKGEPSQPNEPNGTNEPDQTKDSETTVVSGQEISVEKIVEEWTEYAELIENLEMRLKDKEEEVEQVKRETQHKEEDADKKSKEYQQQASETIEKLQFNLKEKSEQVEKARETQLELARKVEEGERKLEETSKREQAAIEKLQFNLKEKSEEVERSRGAHLELARRLEEGERNLEEITREKEENVREVTIRLERLQQELTEKIMEIQAQRARMEELRVDFQEVDLLKTDLKEKDKEIERLRLAESEREEAECKRKTDVEERDEIEELKRMLREKEEEIERLENQRKKEIEALHKGIAKQGEEVEDLKVILSGKGEEIERLRAGENQRKKEIEDLQEGESQRKKEIEVLREEIAKQGGIVAAAQGKLAGAKLQMNTKIIEQEELILELRKTISEFESGASVQSHFAMIDTLSQQLGKAAEAQAKLEEELKSAKTKLEEKDKELENERSLRQSEVIVVRQTKQQTLEEEEHAGGAQFASHPSQNEVEERAEKGKEEKEKEKEGEKSLKDLGAELEALEIEEKGRRAQKREQKGITPLLHIDFKYSVPKTAQAAKAKKQRGFCVCSM
eukprot:Phypoly_transcript_02887.p1 GENE.Phypoly_transcript_02887~~Phypoly_transcript_02887.p1  ORF type:complete len:863 (+),score=262.37 Phypoly_transcript_02887:149-2590(+)